MHFWSIKSKQGNLSYIMESSYTRDKIAIQMNMKHNFTNLDWVNIAYPWETHFSPRDYTNSLEEKVSLKDTRHRMGSSLICASSTWITCGMHMNQFKSLEVFILYPGQGIVKICNNWNYAKELITTKVDRSRHKFLLIWPSWDFNDLDGHSSHLMKCGEIESSCDHPRSILGS
jgi:hypothetical protein